VRSAAKPSVYDKTFHAIIRRGRRCFNTIRTKSERDRRIRALADD
jgi:hypothetical protein